MGFKLVTLGYAAVTGTKVPDNENNGELAQVSLKKDHEGSSQYVLIYDGGRMREVVWRDGQGFAGDIVPCEEVFA
jgi:hypothetical protein